MADFCSNCGNRLGYGDNYCVKCGRKMKDGFYPIPSMPFSLSTSREKKKCPVCGGAGRVEDELSPNCGSGFLLGFLTLGLSWAMSGSKKCSKCDGTGEIDA